MAQRSLVRPSKSLSPVVNQNRKPSDAEAEQEEKSSSDSIDQYDRLLRRLEHKARLLFMAQDGVTCPTSLIKLGDDAPTQFKLDFFDFYAVLERALVHLLSIFRISIARLGTIDKAPFRDTTNVANRSSAVSKTIMPPREASSNHQFHLNVVQAFDRPGPLHQVFGQGQVREDLGLAKDLRNRWKSVSQESSRRQLNLPQMDGGWDALVPDILSYEQLNRILTNIFNGLMAARELAITETKKGQEWEALWRSVQRENGAAVSHHLGDDVMDCDDEPLTTHTIATSAPVLNTDAMDID